MSGDAGAPPGPLPQKAHQDALHPMNERAAENACGGSKGVLPCKKKSYFSLIVIKVNEKKKESYPAGITVDLKIPELGELRCVTSAGARPIMIQNLEPGGKGEVLKMSHATDVYEAIGGFS